MDSQLSIILLVLGTLVAIAPFAISWRISRLGKAITSEPPTRSGTAHVESWATLRGKSALTKQSILCRLRLYDDRIGMRLLWGPEKFIKLSDIRSIERMLKGARTTALKLIPRDRENMEEIFISGIVDVPAFLSVAASAGIQNCEVEDARGMLDLIR